MSLGSKGHLNKTCLEGWGKTRQHWTMRLSYFTPLRSAWNFQLPFPPQGETFLQGGRGVRPIASRRLLCAILSTNQMQNQKQSRLGHPRFPAFRLIGRFALSSHWLFRVFPFLLTGHCDYFGFGFTTLNRKELYLCDHNEYLPRHQFPTCNKVFTPWVSIKLNVLASIMMA